MLRFYVKHAELEPALKPGQRGSLSQNRENKLENRGIKLCSWGSQPWLLLILYLLFFVTGFYSHAERARGRF